MKQIKLAHFCNLNAVVILPSDNTQKRSPIFGVPATTAAGKQVLAVLSLEELLVHALADVQLRLCPAASSRILRITVASGLSCQLSSYG